MHSPLLHTLLAHARREELVRAGAASRLAWGAAAESRRIPPESSVTLRFAFPDDASSLARLATLDSAEPPAQPVLIAEVSGELLAALSLADGSIVADPFHPSVELVQLLRARAAQLTGPGRERRGARPRLRSRFARLARLA